MSRRRLRALVAWTRTMRGRLLLGLMATMLLGLVGSSAVTSVLLGDYLQGRDVDTLRRASERLRSSLAPTEQTVDIEQVRALLGFPLGGIVVDATGQPALTFGSGETAPTALIRRTAAASPGAIVDDDTGGRSSLGIRLPAPRLVLVADDGRRLRASAVVLTIDSDVSGDAIRRLVGYQAIVVCVTLLLLAAFAGAALRVGLRPLREMAEAANAIASGDRTGTLPTHGTGVETDELAIAVNRAFAVRSRAEAAIRDFAADASHELRTPLATISGWLDLRTQGALEDPVARERALDRINAEVGRMRLLVEELSLLARLDAGRPLERSVVDVVALARSIAEDAAVVTPELQITLAAHGPARVVGDEARLGQVLRNLVGNAVQHTPAGTPVHIDVSSSPQEVRIEVSDRGQGIDPAHLPHLFERFWRAEGSRERASGGSGLGLAIVRAIVEAHGGQVVASSPPGQGTTIAVVLPADASPPASVDAEATA